MFVELREVRIGDLDGAGFLFAIAAESWASVRSVRAAMAYSTTFGTVKKPPAFLSVGSI